MSLQKGLSWVSQYEEAKALLEEFASNNYHWSSERGTPRWVSGKCDVNIVTLLASRVDALA